MNYNFLLEKNISWQMYFFLHILLCKWLYWVVCTILKLTWVIILIIMWHKYPFIVLLCLISYLLSFFCLMTSMYMAFTAFVLFAYLFSYFIHFCSNTQSRFMSLIVACNVSGFNFSFCWFCFMFQLLLPAITDWFVA